MERCLTHGKMVAVCKYLGLTPEGERARDKAGQTG